MHDWCSSLLFGLWFILIIKQLNKHLYRYQAYLSRSILRTTQQHLKPTWHLVSFHEINGLILKYLPHDSVVLFKCIDILLEIDNLIWILQIFDIIDQFFAHFDIKIVESVNTFMELFITFQFLLGHEFIIETFQSIKYLLNNFKWWND